MSKPLRNPHSKALVVGAGAGGLASAVLLQHAGLATTLLDKNDFVGGKLSAEQLGGFTFDSGPSILTLPTIISEIFRKTGKDMRDYLELVELDPQWRCFFDDGFSFDFRSGEERMLEEIRTFAPEEVDNFRRLLHKCAELYSISQDNFFFRDYGSVVDVMLDQKSSLWNGMKLVQSIEPLKTYSQLIESYIKNPYLRQALEHLTQYIGSSPMMSPAILGCLLHVQFDKGCWYPKGGMNQISQALLKRFQELGGRVELGRTVSQVYHDGRSVRGVETNDGALWEANEYVINSDYNTFAPLIGEKIIPEKKIACSGVTVFLGLSKKVEGLAHHNFFFSRSHEDEFDRIYHKGLPHDDPTIYACVPSKTDASVAPEGKENVFLLIHTSIDNGKTDWSTYIDGYVDLVKAKVRRMGFDLEAHGVEVESVKSPRDIGRRWNTYLGNIYGEASHGRMSGGFKKKNQSRFSNLQFAGGTVNPGAGVPMSLMSGMTASSNILSRRATFVDLHL